MNKTATPKTFSKAPVSQIPALNERFVRAEEMIQLPPIDHPRGKDGGSGR
jgi:hypothetical protein